MTENSSRPTASENEPRSSGGRAFGQAGSDGVGLPVPAAVLGVPAAGLFGGVPQLVEIGAAALLAAGVVSGLVGGGDQPAGDREW
ncbi:hypothetical protein [Streptomyces sp. NPDC029721]|uniref:hypothetical protein n=1 Tax=Streptomyces sp. NPDC029721 TaxID=3157090 RepID=UPI0033FDB8EE